VSIVEGSLRSTTGLPKLRHRLARSSSRKGTLITRQRKSSLRTLLSGRWNRLMLPKF